MGKLKFLTVFLLLLLFSAMMTTSPSARNIPLEIDHQNQYSHPWGGDEQSGDDAGITATPISPNTYSPYQYATGDKNGIVFGALDFIWSNINVYLTSFTIGSDYDGKTSAGGRITTQSATGPDSGSGGTGGK